MFLTLLGLALGAFWLLLSGFWDNGLLLSLGAVSVVLTLVLSWRIQRQYRFQLDGSLLVRLPRYMLWLMFEVVKANIAVVRNIWFPEDYPISPTVRRLPTLQKTALAKTVFANSITLTPGTVSIDVKEDGVLVHGIMEEAIIELTDGAMNQRVAALEGGYESGNKSETDRNNGRGIKS